MLRVADRELEHVPDPPGSEVAEQEEPSAERARHAGREHAGARNELVAELMEPLDRGSGGSDALPAQSERLAASGRPEDRGHLPTRPVQVRLDDLQHETRRDGRIERVAAALEHGHPGLRREPVRRRDHPEGAAELGASREHARTLVFAFVSTCTHVRPGKPGRREVLQRVRRTPRRARKSRRGATDRLHPLRRPRGIHGACRITRPGGRACVPDAVLRAGANEAAELRRTCREVHRRRGHGSVRRADDIRGRSGASRPRSPRRPRLGRRGQRAGADRGEYGRGDRRARREARSR